MRPGEDQGRVQGHSTSSGGVRRDKCDFHHLSSTSIYQPHTEIALQRKRYSFVMKMSI